jgi:hypothetical protein
MSTLETKIAESIARTLFVCAYADAVENGELDAPGASMGEDWMNIAPETPPEFLHEAFRLIGRIEQLNRMSLVCLLAQAAKADGVVYCEDLPDGSRRGLVEYPDIPDIPDTAREQYTYVSQFGHCLAMQSLGHGVSWFDDHAKFELKTPHIENPELPELCPS